MKKAFSRLLPALFLTALPATVLAAGAVDSTTILSIRQDASVGTSAKTLVPLTEFLSLDLDKLADGNLSAHFYGWADLNFGDRPARIGDNTQADASLTYGYLQYRFPYANAQVRGGRFFISEGILNEQVDGVSARTDLPYGFGISAFGGAPVHTVDVPGFGTDGKGAGIVGGRVHYNKGGIVELGFSGVYESRAASALPFNLAGSYGSHRLLGGDLWLAPHRMVQLAGHTSYNPETGRVAEQSYLMQLFPHNALVLSASYDEQHDRSYFNSSIVFAQMLKNLGQESKSYGGSATYQLQKHSSVSVDFKRYQRDIGKAERIGGEFRTSYAENSVRSGAGYHYLRSSADFAIVPTTGASGSYHEARLWTMRDSKSYFASADLIGYFFKEKVANRSSAWEALGSLGYHLTPALALSGDLSYGRNPQYDDELRGLIRLTYNTTTGKGGTK